MQNIDFRKRDGNPIVRHRKWKFRRKIFMYWGFLLIFISTIIIVKSRSKFADTPEKEIILLNKDPGTESLPAKVLQKNIAKNLHKLTVQDKYRITDCDDTPGKVASTGMPLVPDIMGYFSERALTGSAFFLTETHSWPFLVGIHNKTQYSEMLPIFLVMRGEASGFHKSSMTQSLKSFIRLHEKSLFVTVDEYAYFPPSTDQANVKTSALMPLCHRKHYPTGYVGPFIPGFRFGGAWKLLEKITGSAGNLVFIMYSNSTSPRAEFFKRNPQENKSIDFNRDISPAQFLKTYIEETNEVESKSHRIKGIIDIEGNFEKGPPLWDLLSYIKTRVMNNKNKFYYSAVRIEKADAYPVQVVMVKALGLKGIESADGTVTFTNNTGNVIVEFILNSYEPHYANVNVDLRNSASFSQIPETGKITWQEVNHFTMPSWVFSRLKGKYTKLISYQ